MDKYLSEYIATFCLVFAGTGAIIVNDLSGGQITHVGISLTFGLIVTAMIYAIGNVSGAHLNPAVTIAFMVSGRLAKNQVMPFVACQFLGALTASLFLKFIFPSHETLGLTAPHGPVYQSLILEFLLAFILMFVILNVSTGAKEKGIMAGVAVGSTIALEALFAGPITGASMNPARSLGPALASGQLEHLWIYLSAPVLGALAACPFCRIIQGDDCCPSIE
ncbi:MAG: aquaporin [Candidatus Nitrohelix vancouverensis]|uniref:Aquaporin n=1 Tax=Candidatus Nitrohelix vancouverensis TaxID=2705534 RepID=A0A7T0C496_9BACT|nr:MAG: aquaporin [Candidatus Nitrohelix vancouverensis]